MAEHFSYRALIQGLEKLYARISLRVLHKRIDSYHSSASHKEHAGDIKTALMEFIESTIAQAVKSDSASNERDRISTSIETKLPTSQSETHDLNRERIDELSKYFKSRSNGADLHPPIREKLEHSVWDHIHAALRTARQGDKRNSKMHADIADTACKELAHYMDEESYLALIEDIELHLAALVPNQKDS